MRVTDEDCRHFQSVCSKALGRDITLDEAREALSGLVYLLERFGKWVSVWKLGAKPIAEQPRHLETSSSEWRRE